MSILNSLKLLLPALIPSWNFFDVIAPSPRIQYSLINLNNKSDQKWREFRPRPQHLTFTQMLKRMLWSPSWNETLFLMSCAERIACESRQKIIQHSENEILKRIKNDLIHRKNDVNILNTTHLQFRLIFVQRQEKELHNEIIFISHTEALFMVDAE